MFNHKSSVVALPRGEVCSGRRRRWSEEDKGRIVAESFEKGRTASDVARQHDISPQQLFEWRRQARSGELVVPVTDEMTFAEVSIGLAEPTGVVPDRGDLDLSVNGVTVRVTGRTDMGLVIRVVQALRSFPA